MAPPPGAPKAAPGSRLRSLVEYAQQLDELSARTAVSAQSASKYSSSDGASEVPEPRPQASIVSIRRCAIVVLALRSEAGCASRTSVYNSIRSGSSSGSAAQAHAASRLSAVGVARGRRSDSASRCSLGPAAVTPVDVLEPVVVPIEELAESDDVRRGSRRSATSVAQRDRRDSIPQIAEDRCSRLWRSRSIVQPAGRNGKSASTCSMTDRAGDPGWHAVGPQNGTRDGAARSGR